MDRELEADLVEKARRGETSAAPFLVSCYGERLLGYARAHAPDLADADREHIVELAIEAGVRALGRFDPDRGSLESWFRGQVRFQTLGWRRRTPVRAEVERLSDLPDTSPSLEPDAPESVVALRRAISRLSDDDQLVLALRSAEQIAFAEIGQRLSISETAARQRHHRALARLRAELALEPELEHLAEEATP